MPNHKTAFIEYRAVSTPLQGKAHAVPNMKNAHTNEEERRRVCYAQVIASTTCKYGSCSPMPMHALPRRPGLHGWCAQAIPSSLTTTAQASSRERPPPSCRRG